MEEVDGACAGCGADVVAVLHHGVFVASSDLDVESAVSLFLFTFIPRLLENLARWHINFIHDILAPSHKNCTGILPQETHTPQLNHARVSNQKKSAFKLSFPTKRGRKPTKYAMPSVPDGNTDAYYFARPKSRPFHGTRIARRALRWLDGRGEKYI